MIRRLLYIASYDITQNTRRRKVHAAIKQFATGGQKSAYECYVSGKERNDLFRICVSLIDQTDDRFALLPVEMSSEPILCGTAVPPTDPEFYYVG